MPTADSGTLHFTVDSKLLFELGEQLVARKWVALAELVKNAYDSDAKEVEITLLHAGKKSGRIIVKDDGVGMTFDVLKQSWMRLGTTTKTQQPRSEKYGRLRTGAKGVGRFACRRLGAKLNLASTPEGEDETIRVTFDWDKFVPGTELSQVLVTYERGPSAQETPGVTLTLERLREPWTRDDVQQLQKELLQLVSPDVLRYSKSSADPGFVLRIDAPEYPELSGSLAEQFTQTAWATLSGKLDQKGKPKYELAITRTGEVLSFSPDVTFRRAGRCHFSLAYVIYRGEFFRKVPFTVTDAREYGREHGGVRIYMDGFRVFPYGDPGDDWLELDANRARRLTATPEELQGLDEDLERPMLFLPGNMQLFGGVYLSREANRRIALSITRERLLENEAFDEVRKFVRLGINWMTVQYARFGVKQRDVDKNRTGTSPLEHLDELRKELASATELEASARQRMLQALSLARADYEREQNEQISELAMLRILASVGTMVVIFDHELRALVDSLHGIVTDTKSITRRLSATDRKQLTDIVGQLEGWTESVEQQGAYLGLLLSPESRQRRRRHALREVVADAEKSFKRYMGDLSIEFVNDVPASLRTPALFRSELQSILLNLLTNALKATRRCDIRRIRVSARKADDGVIIEMCDTGVGIPDDIKDSVFEPFVTTSEPDPVLGVGTGLGLKIVKDIAESYGGSAWVSDSHDEWSTCISISLPTTT